MKYFISIVCVLLLVVASFYSYGRLRSNSDNLSIDHLSKYPSTSLSDHVRFATYNIAHGRGPKLGESNSNGSITEKTARLNNIGTFLKESRVDIVVMNEVDFSTHWSGYIDQASIVAEAGEFPFIARQINFDLLIPGFSLQFGNAILSRFPIQSARRERLPALSKVESWLFGNHDAIEAVIRLNTHLSMRLWGLHLEVRDEATRIQAIQQILQNTNTTEPVIIAGDLNSRLSTNESPTAFSTMLSTGRFGTYPEPGSQNNTFPSLNANRIIDWILYSSEWHLVNGDVPKLGYSDHLPVLIDLTLK